MKTILIKSLILTNFKGIRKLTIDNFNQETFVHGANGTGKTSIVDAFTWLLFGKNSIGETNFEIKTLDKDNNVIPKIDHEVEAVIDVDGQKINIKRTFREKWVKKRGSLEAEFGGNETLYHWNDVPMTQRDFNSKISDLVDESVFKMITSPIAFNALKWQDQRQVLLDISGGVTDQEVAKGNPDFEGLLSKLVGKSLPEYEKQIKASIKKSKDEIKAIPTRIDEVERNKPEAVDFNGLQKELDAKQKEPKGVDSQITDRLQAQQEVLNKRSKIQKEIHQLETEISDIKHKAKLQAKEQIRSASSIPDQMKAQISEKNETLSKARRTLDSIDSQIKQTKEFIDSLNVKNNAIRQKWNKRNAETFQMDEDACKCPTCKRAFEADDIEAKKKEMEENFQKAKMEDLNSITARGKKNAALIAENEKEVQALEERKEKGKAIIDDLVAELEELSAGLETAEDNTDVKSENEIVAELLEGSDLIGPAERRIEELNEALQNEEGVNIQDLKEEKALVTEDIERLKSQLAAKNQIEQANKRIAALEKEESQLAQQIADYEKDQFTIEQFNKAKDSALENLVNHRFKLVNFKLFETQANGGEVPTCKALINGVPFSDANTASKINAGIDIINTLCDHYGVSAPIFVDNRESVSELIQSKSQIISLIVSPKDSKPRIEAPELAELF